MIKQNWNKEERQNKNQPKSLKKLQNFQEIPEKIFQFYKAYKQSIEFRIGKK